MHKNYFSLKDLGNEAFKKFKLPLPRIQACLAVMVIKIFYLYLAKA